MRRKKKCVEAEYVHLEEKVMVSRGASPSRSIPCFGSFRNVSSLASPGDRLCRCSYVVHGVLQRLMDSQVDVVYACVEFDSVFAWCNMTMINVSNIASRTLCCEVCVVHRGTDSC